MAGADVLGKLRCHRPCDYGPPITTLCDKMFVPQHIYHKRRKPASSEHGSKSGFGWRVSRAKAWYAWDNDMEGLGRSVWWIGKRLDNLAGFEERAWPALNEK